MAEGAQKGTGRVSDCPIRGTVSCFFSIKSKKGTPSLTWLRNHDPNEEVTSLLLTRRLPHWPFISFQWSSLHLLEVEMFVAGRSHGSSGLILVLFSKGN